MLFIYQKSLIISLYLQYKLLLLFSMKPIPKTIQIKQGFYPSFIYLQPTQEIKKQRYFEQICSILTKNKIVFKEVEDIHLSLSKTFHPVYAQIQNIVNKCKLAIKSKKINLPIVLLFNKVHILQNFITLSVEKITADRLLPIAKQIQHIINEPFYENPIFHVSLFKIESQVSPWVLQQILQVNLSPKKSYTLKRCLMKSGIVTYQLNS